MNEFENLMLIALEQAKLAASLGEVPIGAVVAKNGEIISKAHNLVETNKDASLHAEILALQAAAKILGDWRLTECILCVTLEPCSMCIGAAKLFRINTLVFGAEDPAKGACGSLFDLSQDNRLGPNPKLITGIFQEESLKLLQDFFKAKR